ncbi:5522_t:CDS:2 [Racocetra fulgida]|uniref:5522_t:CDS:1 n=1 Tax=Racocetra fulgida TaxID=60492 RepID=A0A9N8ZL80_9GLOM|nr:5522_t:CDS:2 [Racocetra fulgida]
MQATKFAREDHKTTVEARIWAWEDQSQRGAIHAWRKESSTEIGEARHKYKRQAFSQFHIISEPLLDIILDQSVEDVKNGNADPYKPSNPSLLMPKVLSLFDEVWKTHYDESSNKSKRVLYIEHSSIILKATSETSFLTSPQFLEMTHTFLIRNPEKSVKSLYKAATFILNKSLKLRLRESKQIFDLLKDLNKKLIVVDADDLINDPERVLKKYCELIDEEYKQEMIHWEATTVNDNAENSTGFNKFTNKYDHETEYPQIVYDAIAENKPYYDYLYQFRI